MSLYFIPISIRLPNDSYVTGEYPVRANNAEEARRITEKHLRDGLAAAGFVADPQPTEED